MKAKAFGAGGRAGWAAGGWRAMFIVLLIRACQACQVRPLCALEGEPSKIERCATKERAPYAVTSASGKQTQLGSMRWGLI